MKKTRPKIKVKPNTFDKCIEILSWVALLLMWGVVLWFYEGLPETIPTHFNAAGEPDAWGDKPVLFILPGMASLLFLLISLVGFFPHKFNYSIEITAENAAFQYLNALRMMRVLKLAVVILFLFILVMTIRTAFGKAEGLGWWFILAVLVLNIGPIIYFLNRSYQKNIK